MMGQMSTAISTHLPPGSTLPEPTSPEPTSSERAQSSGTPGYASGNTPANTPTTAPTTSPQSAQTVVSSAPVSSAPMAVAGAGVAASSSPGAEIPTAGVNSDMRTAMVSPLGNAATDVSSGPSVVYAQTGSSGAAWKGPAIIGGLVGLSIVVGALVVTDQLPLLVADNTETTDVVVPADSISPDSSAADDVSEDSDPEDDEATDEPEETTPPTEPTPTITPAAPLNANGTVVGQGGSKNIRSGAGTGFNVVAEVSVSDRIQVIGRTNDSDGYPWYRVVTPSGSRGWIAGQLIQIDGDAKPVTPQPRPTPTPTPTPTPVDRTNATIVSQEAGSKNIRSGPGIGYGVAHEAYPGDRVIIQDSAQDVDGYTWYKISFPESGAQGWIAAQLINRD